MLGFRKFAVGAVSAVFAATLAMSAGAATHKVSFEFLDWDKNSVASGGFSYKSGHYGGVVGFKEVDNFSINVLGSNYDSKFIDGGSFSPFHAMAFNTAKQTFETQAVSWYGYTYKFIIAAISANFQSGFFVGAENVNNVVADYPGANRYNDIAYYHRLNVKVDVNGDVAPVPLPASLPLFALALGLLGLTSWRRSERRASVFRA